MSICDFCSAPKPARRYSCRPFKMTGPKLRSVGGWAACNACAELIDADRWEDLADRSVDSFLKKYPVIARERALREIQELHQQFRDNRE